MDIGSYFAGVFSGLGIAGVLWAYWEGEVRNRKRQSEDKL